MVQRIVTGALLALAVVGCMGNVTRGSGKTATETRDVSGFSAVQLAWLGDLTITQGGTEGLTIEAEDNILPLISTQVDGDTLVIGVVDGMNSDMMVPTQSVKFNLQVRDLNAITLSGAGNITTQALKADTLHVILSGAGNVDLKDVITQALDATSSGAGNITLAGKADTQSTTLSGLGSLTAGDLQSSAVTVAISGAGNATVWAEKTLDVQISGAGSVSYYGSPQVTQSISGVGSVKSLGSK